MARQNQDELADILASSLNKKNKEHTVAFFLDDDAAPTTAPTGGFPLDG
jgi:hypothetical protein